MYCKKFEFDFYCDLLFAFKMRKKEGKTFKNIC